MPPPTLPPAPYVSSDTLQAVARPDTTAARADSSTTVSTPAVSDSITATDTLLVVPADTTRNPKDEPWIFEGGTLKATQTSEGMVHQATSPVVRHGTMVLSGDSGTYMREGEVGTVTGHVHLADEGVEGEADRATYYRNERKLIAEGHVKVWSDTLWVAGPHMEYNRDTRIAIVRGGAYGQDGERVFGSRRLEWNRDSDSMVLMGDARVQEPDGSVVDGETIIYDLTTKVAKVEGQPDLLLASQNGVQTRLRADDMWLRDPNAFARGSVTIFRGRIQATGDSVAYFGDTRRAVLLGTPQVEEPNGTLWADTLYLAFREDESLESVDAVGHAGLRYTPLDSGRVGEVSEVDAENMHIVFSDGHIDSLIATPEARSRYRPAPEALQEEGENVASGDTIIIQMGDDSGVDWVKVLGNAHGTYTFGAPDSTAADSSAAPTDSLNASAPDPPDAAADTILNAEGSGAAGDSLRASPGPGRDPGGGPPPSTPGREKVVYEAHQVLFRFKERTVAMEGSAKADYDPMTLTADTVTFHLRNRYLEAEGNPTLNDRSQANQDPIVGTRMDYNLDTKEGRVKQGRTHSESGYVYADQLRQVGDGDFLARNGSMTSCPLVEEGKSPHFHFGSNEMRIYLNDKVVARPITLYIRDMPVFRLPFYVFPIRRGRQSGFLTPQFGFGLGGEESRFIKRFGYYWATNDYMDLEARTDWYDQENKLVPALAWRYKWLKYDMNGNASLRHLRSTRQSLWDLSAGHYMTWNDWRVTATGEYRDQEFRGEEAVTGNIGQAVDRILKNSLDLSRSLGFGSLRLSLKSTRDLAVSAEDGRDDNVVTETLPEYNFSVNSHTLGRQPDEDGQGGFLPFLSNTSWSFSSSGRRQNFRDEVTRIDSTGADLDTLVTQESTHQTQATHRLSLSDRRKLLGAVSVGPTFSLTEHWVDREYSATDTSMGFNRAATWTASLDATTQMFGTVGGIGPVQSLRHVVKPRASLQYAPNTDGLLYTDASGARRNRFPGVSGFEQQSLALSLDQAFQAKVHSGEGIKRVDLMNWNLRTSYDFLKDDKRFSNVSSQVSLRKIMGVTVNFNSTHDPYAKLRFTQYTVDGAFGFSGTLPGAEAGALGDMDQSSPDNNSLEQLGGDVFDPDRNEIQRENAESLTYRASFSYSVAGSRQFDDRFDTRSTLRSSFQVQLTQNWGLNYSNVWRISDGEITGERFSVSRDLHCWEAHLEGNRVGDNLAFYFRINIKELQDIKIEQGRQGAEIGGLSRILP